MPGMLRLLLLAAAAYLIYRGVRSLLRPTDRLTGKPKDPLDRVGTPLVEQAQVTAEIVEQGLDRKIIVFKKKRRKGYSRKQGHRQMHTTLRIVEIHA